MIEFEERKVFIMSQTKARLFNEEMKAMQRIKNDQFKAAKATQFTVGQPGFSQPGIAQPGLAQPGVTQTGVAQPEFVQLGVVQLGVTQPGLVQLGIAQPAVS